MHSASTPSRFSSQLGCDTAGLHASEILKRSEQLASVIDVLPSGIVILDGEGKVIQANQAAIAILGEPLVEEQWRDIIARSFSPKADDGYEVSLKDGRLVKFETQPLADAPGQLIVMTDLTETRQLQSRIAHMQRLSSLGKMVASLAHQVRTPLAAAMLYAANLGNESLNLVARKKFQGKLVDRLQDLENQVNDMLLFARSGEGLATGQLSSQELLSSVEQSAEVMLRQHHAELEVCLPEPDQLLTGNPNALASAISNLVHNALQAGGNRIQLAAVAQGEFLEVCVIDNGSGIPDSQLEKIKEPFYTTRSQGTGLGLAVVQAVVQAHQGQFTIQSQQGVGTRVCIRLPLPAQDLEQPTNAEAVGE